MRRPHLAHTAGSPALNTRTPPDAPEKPYRVLAVFRRALARTPVVLLTPPASDPMVGKLLSRVSTHNRPLGLRLGTLSAVARPRHERSELGDGR